MRKLLASIMSVGLLAAPTAAAFAQDNDTGQDLDRPRAEPLDVAQVRVDRAAERVEERHDQIRERRSPPAPSGAGGDPSPQLEAIAQCESGGDYTANTGNGFYGAYQFTQETWESVGGTGLPSEAPPAEQDMRAQMLLERSGTSPWPVCGS